MRQDGITPAHAGKRLTRATRLMLKRDHPRACGEKFDEEGECKLQVGSPPRMRGKEGKFKADYDKDGITPAHAGKSDRVQAGV